MSLVTSLLQKTIRNLNCPLRVKVSRCWSCLAKGKRETQMVGLRYAGRATIIVNYIFENLFSFAPGEYLEPSRPAP